MTTYRLVAIGDGIERDVGVVETLVLPPHAILIVSLPPDTLDTDLHRTRQELRGVFDKYEGWKDRPIGVIRAGDVKFLRLVPIESGASAVSTEGAAWAMETQCICTDGDRFGHHPNCPASPEYKARHTTARPEQE